MAEDFKTRLSPSDMSSRAWNQTDEEKRHFAIDDVVQSLTESANVKDDIKKLRKGTPEKDTYWGTHCSLAAMPGADSRMPKELLKKEGNESMTICNGLKIPAGDGKQHLKNIADPLTLLRQLQSSLQRPTKRN